MDERITCIPCGKSVSKNIYEKHCKTATHLRHLKRQQSDLSKTEDLNETESESEESSIDVKESGLSNKVLKRKTPKKYDHLEGIRTNARTVKMTNIENGETVVYRSLYQAQKASKLNANLIKMFCEQPKDAKKKRAYIENKDGDRFRFQYTDEEPNEKREILTTEEKREKQLQYNRDYNKTHRDKILEFHKTKEDCACGGSYMRVNKGVHKKSKKHQEYLRTQAPEQVQAEQKLESESESEAESEAESEQESESEVERKIISTKTTSSDIENEDDDDDDDDLDDEIFKLDIEFQT